MITVQVEPRGARFNEFVRVNIIATDSNMGVLEIRYTSNGAVPDTFGSDTIIRRSPIMGLPLSQPTTIKFFVRNLLTLEETAVQTEFYDIIEINSRQEISSTPEGVTNYTLKIQQNDLVRTQNGLFDIVYGIDKTAQDVREVILVENVPENTASGNRLLPNWGSGLNRIFGSSLPAVFAASLIQTEIFKALNELMRLQRLSSVPSDERIKNIARILVIPKSETDYAYDFEVVTVSGRVINESGVIRGVA